MKNAVFCAVAPCSYCVNRRFGRTVGSLAPRLLGQCSHGNLIFPFPRQDPIPALTCYLLAHLEKPFPPPPYWFPMWPLSIPFLFLYSWVSSTGDSVCSHLLTLVPRSQISYTLKMEAIRSSETSFNTISTWRHTPENGILKCEMNFNIWYELLMCMLWKFFIHK
jgi:hypothetical protein